nr:MAG TPA: protein of unknown function (DUF5047) [Caudoviricetes sp.]
MINIGAEDYNVLKQQYIKKYIRLELLDFQYNIVDELSGNMTKCSINVDSNSDLRRSCDLGFVVTTSTFDIKSGQKLWLDKFVRPFVGYENMRTGKIQWYNKGIYLVNNPQWAYNASTNEISMQALDLMSKLTGLRNGNLEGIPTVIAKDENVREAIISTLALGGFTKYICEECKTNDGTIVPVPYDIEIDVGGTIYDILTGLRDIMPNYQIYFDVNGVFHYEPIPLAYDDPVLIDDDLWPSLLISENINTDFESVKNYVEVLGHTWDVDYYSPSESTTVSGGTITPTFADLKQLQQDTAVGITLPSDIANVDKITINCLGSNDVVDIDDVPIKLLAKDTEWIFQFVAGPTLPDGYTQVEYIQSSGTQYINTGFKPTGNTMVSVDFSAYNQTTSQQGIFGSRPGTSGRFTLFTGNSTASLQADYDTKQTLANQNAEISGLDLTKRVNISMSNKLVIDGNTVSSTTIKSFTSTYDMYLFANNNVGVVQLPSSLNLYSCAIYDDNTLVRNFIPCKNPDGVVGLYDSINSQFYQNAGSGTFTDGPEVEQEDKGGPFWRFMGHQQAQALSYDNNPSSPFYVGDPIGSSSVGRIRIVLYGGEYDNIYSDDLAKQRADFEIYQRSRLNDSISMETIPIPWMDANIVVSHRFGQKQEPSKYIVKSFSVDYATGGTMTINAISWYPYYEESEVV